MLSRISTFSTVKASGKQKSSLNFLFKNKGSAAVEFALCLYGLLLVLFGIMEYGWYMTNQIVLSNAVSCGARAGIKAKEWEGESPVILARTAARKSFWISELSNIRIDTLEESLNNPRRLRVSSSLEYSPLTGFLPSELIPEYVKARAVMVFP
jgi:hypothetical protein